MTVAVAIGATWWWPFAVSPGVTGLTYLTGLAVYGTGQGQAGDTAGQHAPFPLRG
jgi:hypothetical protein